MALVLFVITILLFLLPLVPAFIEIVWPTDITPLRVVQSYDNNPLHFAAGFKRFIDNHFDDLHENKERDGKLANGTDYQVLDENEEVSYSSRKGADHLVLSHYPMRLADGKIFLSEIYSKRDIITGDKSRFRALLSENSLTIGSNCKVLRWAHSDGEMRVRHDTTLLGRTTSHTGITLAPGCYFERLYAPKIIIGEEMPALQKNIPTDLTVMENMKGVKIQSGRRRVLEGDLDFPAYSTFDGDIIAGSTAIIGDYAHIKGSIKSNAMNDIALYLQKTGVKSKNEKTVARCELGNFVRIDGSVISTHDLYIGENCRIAGPVIAENLLVIRAGTIIGTPEQPCTVIAPAVAIESGCIIYGTLRATGQGFVTIADSQSIQKRRWL